MVSRVTLKYQLIHRTKRRPPSLALTELLPTDACLLAYVMLLARSMVNDVHFHGHDRGNNGGLHGRFLGLQGFFLFMPLPFRQNAQKDCPDFEASHARGFVLRSLELQILSFIMGIQYPNLID
ncbi:hypothetical protein Tco_0007330 [Tanacetum coccineum]